MTSTAMRARLAAGAAATLLLAACGGAATGPAPGVEGGESADAVILAAVDASSAYDTYRVAFTVMSESPDGSGTATGTGVVSSDESQLTMRMTGLAAAGMGDDVELEMRIVDNVMYQRFPALLQQFDTDAEWLSLDLATMGPEVGQLLDQARSADPTQSLQQLRDVADVEEVGSETVAGVETTHYRGTVTLGDSFDALEIDPTGVPGSENFDLDQPLPIEVWIDGDGLFRRSTTTFEVMGVRTTTTQEVLEYGVEVAVEAPPADLVIGYDELASLAPAG